MNPRNLFFASDYFEKMYGYAVELIQMGKAYVCDLTFEEIQQYRGAPNVPGKESPFPESFGGGEPGPVWPDAGGRI